ncbi:hypothetical protein M2141_002484 [Lachnospiraceae bacterium PH5-48]
MERVGFMFGIVVGNKNELTTEELARYRSVYCGLCQSLKSRYGQIERLTLNYDMTFLALLLEGLYEEDEREKEIRCLAHPTKKQVVIANEFIDYAADMTILLAYYKAEDDIADEGKVAAKVLKKLLHKDFLAVARIYPRQAECVKTSLEELSKIEKSPTGTPDEAVNLSGRMLSEVFVYKEDFWADTLRDIGYELGRFIYLADAALDYEKDKKEKSYNPLFLMDKKPEEIRDIMEQAIGSVSFLYDRLPIIKDTGIMENIIYSGVWQQYNIKVKEEKNQDGK